jgi:ACS family tartrate transporter-like MFS transporter
VSGLLKAPRTDTVAPGSLEGRVLRKVTLRLIPFLALCYFIAYLNRVNLSFGALQMNKALGLSHAAYGFGAGLFFITYCLCEVPSNLALHRFGARRWIARIMVTWGLCAGAMAFVRGADSFYLVRLLLGAAEQASTPASCSSSRSGSPAPIGAGSSASSSPPFRSAASSGRRSPACCCR